VALLVLVRKEAVMQMGNLIIHKATGAANKYGRKFGVHVIHDQLGYRLI